MNLEAYLLKIFENKIQIIELQEISVYQAIYTRFIINSISCLTIYCGTTDCSPHTGFANLFLQ